MSGVNATIRAAKVHHRHRRDFISPGDWFFSSGLDQGIAEGVGPPLVSIAWPISSGRANAEHLGKIGSNAPVAALE